MVEVQHLPDLASTSGTMSYAACNCDGTEHEGYTYNTNYHSHTNVSVPLAHMDFIPVCMDPGGVFSDKTFERFDVLIKRCNEWLKVNTHLKVKTAESIEVKKRHGDHGEVDTEKVTYYEYGEYRNRYIRALRVWITSKEHCDLEGPQQIGHMNVVPICRDPGGVFTHPKFESFGETLDRVNEILKNRPLHGKMLNLETQDMKFHTWEGRVDPDETYWTEAGKTGTYFLNVIRIFYEIGPPAYEEVECADFVPSMLEEGGFITTAKFQLFGAMAAHCWGWVSQQTGIRIISLQSIDYKLKSSWSGGSLDTHRTMFYKKGRRGEWYTYYLRIIRVAYTRTFGGYEPPPNAACHTPLLNYKTFSPIQLTKDAAFSTPRFETLSETVRRATAWLHATGVKVISAETVPVRLYSGNQHGNPEQTYTWNLGDRHKTWLFVVRLYLDGDYSEPPLDMLPPVPQIPDEECDCGCVVS